MTSEQEISEMTLETTSHGRDFDPPCLWEIPPHLESEFQLFKEQSLPIPRYAKLHGKGLRQAFWNLREGRE
jgi:hypothetical protein